jgi:hypothetical protein
MGELLSSMWARAGAYETISTISVRGAKSIRGSFKVPVRFSAFLDSMTNPSDLILVGIASN